MPRILVVDDDRSIRLTLEKLLTDAGHEVLTASTGPEGRDLMRAEHPDVTLLDLNLPGMGGLDVLRELQASGDLPTTVVISARGDMRSTIQAIQEGAYDFLHKPLDLEKLELTLDRALHSAALHQRLASLVAEAGSDSAIDQIVGQSAAIRDVFKTIAAATTTHATVLITGESGTGKELVARAIHYNGRGRAAPFVAVNCSAIAPGLLESELFGHVRGAFTGATETKEGRFAAAGEGTLFLDEVGELSLDIQVKLLRVLHERVFEPVGSTRSRPLKARILAATNRNLPQMIEEGAFREDLYYRLKVLEIHLPPLRERREDLPLLIDHLLEKVSRELHKPVRYLEDDARLILLRYDWPGNIRELENALTRAAVLARGGVIEAEHLPMAPPAEGANTTGGVIPLALSTEGLTRLKDVERLHIVRMLAQTGFHKRLTSELLDISRPTLDNKIQSYAISRQEVEELMRRLWPETAPAPERDE